MDFVINPWYPRTALIPRIDDKVLNDLKINLNGFFHKCSVVNKRCVNAAKSTSNDKCVLDQISFKRTRSTLNRFWISTAPDNDFKKNFTKFAANVEKIVKDERNDLVARKNITELDFGRLKKGMENEGKCIVPTDKTKGLMVLEQKKHCDNVLNEHFKNINDYMWIENQEFLNIQNM